jgi:predicted Zn finger-like uncharacterized protein
MRLVTRCPACRALFEVREKQLRACQGWLRCGQCLQAYDSTGLVLPWTGVSVSAGVGRRVDIRTLLHQPDASKPVPLTVETHALGKPLRPELDASLAVSAAVLQPVALEQPGQHDAPLPAHQQHTKAEPEGAAPKTKADRPAARVHRSWPWLLACTLATLLLVAQVQQAHWGTLTLKMPVLQRWGQGWCELTGCSWPAVRAPDALYLESARLIREEDRLLLNLRVRNTAPVEVAFGALELSLLGQDARLLVRRVLSPPVLGAPSVLAAGAVWEGRLLLKFEEPSQVQSYKALMFLP